MTIKIGTRDGPDIRRDTRRKIIMVHCDKKNCHNVPGFSLNRRV